MRRRGATDPGLPLLRRQLCAPAHGLVLGLGTYGSRSGAVGMSAIAKAIDKVIAKGKKVAAHVLEAAESDIEF